MPTFKFELTHDPTLKGGAWVIDMLRQEKKYAKWVQITRSQGKVLSEALAACQYGCKQQENQHPEIW